MSNGAEKFLECRELCVIIVSLVLQFKEPQCLFSKQILLSVKGIPTPNKLTKLGTTHTYSKIYCYVY